MLDWHNKFYTRPLCLVLLINLSPSLCDLESKVFLLSLLFSVSLHLAHVFFFNYSWFRLTDIFEDRTEKKGGKKKAHIKKITKLDDGICYHQSAKKAF